MNRLQIRESGARVSIRTAFAAPAAVARKKATGVRPWLLLDSSGKAQLIEEGKHAIMKRTGLPARDLRILDPLLSYPSTLLGRERAVVINLEHIKAIITAQEVLLLNSRDPSVSPFVDELQHRILFHHRAKLMESKGEETGSPGLISGAEKSVLTHAQTPATKSHFVDLNVENQAHENRDECKILPFEFVALEACLEAACSCLEHEAKTLEQEAHPALDKLTSKISTLNLERVRQIKSRLVAISGRVQKVRDELEHLLDDDEDMAEMYLTDKMVQQNLESSSTYSVSDPENIGEENLPDDSDMIVVDGPSANPDNQIDNSNDPFSIQNALSRASHGSRTSISHSATTKFVDVDELEMLLEAYFIQIDGTMNKLSTLREYVDDTEDYINIMLDDKQNHLLQMGVMLTTATLVLSCFVVVAGIFGMNIQIDWFQEEVSSGMKKFMWTVCSGTTGSIFLYIVAIAWCKHRRLIE